MTCLVVLILVGLGLLRVLSQSCFFESVGICKPLIS